MILEYIIYLEQLSIKQKGAGVPKLDHHASINI